MNSRQSMSDEFEYKYDGRLDGVAITKYTGSSTSVCIPESLGVEEVRKINKRAFSNCSQLMSVIIESNTMDIDEYAFLLYQTYKRKY